MSSCNSLRSDPEELAFYLATHPRLWRVLEQCVAVDDHEFVRYERGFPFTLPPVVLPCGGLRMDRMMLQAQGHAAYMRRWALRWGGRYDAETGVLHGCALGLSETSWRTFVG